MKRNDLPRNANKCVAHHSFETTLVIEVDIHIHTYVTTPIHLYSTKRSDKVKQKIIIIVVAVIVKADSISSLSFENSFHRINFRVVHLWLNLSSFYFAFFILSIILCFIEVTCKCWFLLSAISDINWYIYIVERYTAKRKLERKHQRKQLTRSKLCYNFIFLILKWMWKER